MSSDTQEKLLEPLAGEERLLDVVPGPRDPLARFPVKERH